jgi:hypothetical protein
MMKTQLASVLTQVALILAAGLAWASDCSVSREFELKHSQVLRGTLQDPQGLALSGSRIELLSGKQVFRSLRTDNLGIYDFGEIQPGTYRVQGHANAFCAPQVVCKAEGCSFSSKLKLNSKNLVTVH